MSEADDKKVISLWKSRYDALMKDYNKLAFAFYLLYGGEMNAVEDGFTLLREYGLINEDDEWVFDDEG